FLQGLSDGDGSASFKGKYLCITSKHNQEFIKDLFRSLNVIARITGTDIVTSGYEQAKRAARLPMFRFSDERLESSKKMVKMIDSKRDIMKNPALPHEIDFMVKKWKEGMSLYDIHVATFDEFGTTIDRRTIGKLIQKKIRKERGHDVPSDSI
ncbi:MAG: hypothetical protein P1Q69_19280, partial [Candidatus Thorarchaeota archaeon]|nr:hypothetical protein [Candidatus Thorarchaeota archaeon]